MPEKLNFEESLQKLEEIAEKLEQGNINLDESVRAGQQTGCGLPEEAGRRTAEARKAGAKANGGEAGAKGGAGCIIFSSD